MKQIFDITTQDSRKKVPKSQMKNQLIESPYFRIYRSNTFEWMNEWMNVHFSPEVYNEVINSMLFNTV